MKRILFAYVFFTISAAAQELQADVTINIEKLPSSVRDYLANFESDVERYLNNTRFTDEDLSGERIQCSLNIFFESVTGDNRYTARVFVGSLRPVYVGNDKSTRSTPILRIMDDRWEFIYVPNQLILFDEFRFDALTDFLDFYAYLIIGFDLETYTEFSGSRYFQKALNIANQATSTAFSRDWQPSQTYSKFSIADEINNNKYQPFRLAFFAYHFEGIDLLATETQKGLDNVLSAVETISELRRKQDSRSVLIRAFFEAKYLEIAEIFLRYPDRSVYGRLITADPVHQSTYQEYSGR